ncbi:MAG: polyphosphate kinase 2 family protein, partial [Armatimonadetes bacterium]|nr:polyphosphate kinase 2 family protein [Armatimonadota bacterium]
MPYALKLSSPQEVQLNRISTRAPEGLTKEAARAETDRLREELAELQELLWGAAQQSVLVVLQGMDAAGKDGV